MPKGWAKEAEARLRVLSHQSPLRDVLAYVL